MAVKLTMLAALVAGACLAASAGTRASNQVIERGGSGGAPAGRLFESYDFTEPRCYEVGLVDDSGSRPSWDQTLPARRAPTKYLLWDVDPDRSDDVVVDPELERFELSGIDVSTARNHVVVDPFCRWLASYLPAIHTDGPSGRYLPRMLLVLSLDGTILDVDILREISPFDRVWSIDDGPVLTDRTTGRIEAVSVITDEVIREWNVPPDYELLDVSADGHTLLLRRSFGDGRDGVAVQQGWSPPVDLFDDASPSMSPSGNRIAGLACEGLHSNCEVRFVDAADGYHLRSVQIGSSFDWFHIIGWQMLSDREVAICTTEELFVVDVDGERRTVERIQGPVDIFQPTPQVRRCMTSLVPTPGGGL